VLEARSVSIMSNTGQLEAIFPEHRGHRLRQLTFKFFQLAELGPNVFEMMRSDLATSRHEAFSHGAGPVELFPGSLAVRARSTVNIVKNVTHRQVAGTDTGD